MAGTTRHGIEGYTRMPYGSFAGKSQQTGYTPGAASPDDIGRALRFRSWAIWIAVSFLLFP